MDDRRNMYLASLEKQTFEEYANNTLRDIKDIIVNANIPESDKRHFLDVIWVLAQYAKDGSNWNVEFGDRPENTVPMHNEAV